MFDMSTLHLSSHLAHSYLSLTQVPSSLIPTLLHETELWRTIWVACLVSVAFQKFPQSKSLWAWLLESMLPSISNPDRLHYSVVVDSGCCLVIWVLIWFYSLCPSIIIIVPRIKDDIGNQFNYFLLFSTNWKIKGPLKLCFKMNICKLHHIQSNRICKLHHT
jgi:hypothetical protein